MGNLRLELNESGPSKFEWALAFLVMGIPFVSFCYFDTACFIMYELKFAQAILHGNLKEAYEPVVKVVSAMGGEVSSLSVYDLPLNLVFGLWGIPLYLYSVRSGTLEITFPQSFWQMLYGKSILLIAFTFSAILVYKICTALDISRNRSRWGAYIYFSSAMATTAIGIIGQCDVFAVCLTLLGVLAYIRNQNKKFLLWFVLAAQFKQFALFVFIPLMLLRDKNLLRAAGRMLLILAVGAVCNGLIAYVSPSSFVERMHFTAGMALKLLTYKLPLFCGKLSLFVLAFGALCIYCWLHDFKDKSDKTEVNTQTVFVALLSMVILFTSFPSHPYWFMHMIPYLAITAVYHSRNTEKILLFETLGIAAVVFLNYVIFWGAYTPSNSINMFLHNILLKFTENNSSVVSSIVEKSLIDPKTSLNAANTALNSVSAGSLKGLLLAVMTEAAKHGSTVRSIIEAVYCACIYAVVYLSYPKNYVQGGGALRQVLHHASFAV